MQAPQPATAKPLALPGQVVHRPARWAATLLAVTVVGAVLWLNWAEVDIITHADGKLVPQAREQVIASQEGGLLAQVLVKEGEAVQAGQVLVQLDPTRSRAQQQEAINRSLSLRATLARTQAELSDQAMSGAKLTEIPSELLQAEIAQYQRRKQALQDSLQATRRSIGMLEREIKTSRELAARGLMSDFEVLRLERELNELNNQGQERINRYHQEAAADAARAQAELAQLEQQLVVKDDIVARTDLKAPIAGWVKNLRYVTQGGVVAPGSPILEIVPPDAHLSFEVKVKPSDIAFIQVGQSAVIKLTAYDYYLYGGLNGVVDYVSPDTLVDERPTDPQSAQGYYKVRVRAAGEPFLQRVNQNRAQVPPASLIPGMTASIEIRTGQRTLMNYLLKPVLRGTEAFRER